MAGQRGMLLIISGPSGVGKTTITREVERAIEGSEFSVSATTRPRTGADREGADYHFLTREEFLRRVGAGEFLEHAEYAGNLYGTLRAPVERALAEGRVMILEIDVQGAKQVKAKMPGAFGVFVLPPSEEALLERLRARKREAEDVIQRRFRIAQEEIAEAKRCGAYDMFIVNDDLDRAVGEAVAAVRKAQSTKHKAQIEKR